MKEIKAYIRPDRIEEVVDALEEAGISGMTVIQVQAIGAVSDPEQVKLSMELARKYSHVVKLEIICADAEMPRFVELIRQKGRTGRKGDGMIFVSEVVEAVSIRTGRTGPESLTNPDE